MYRKADRLVESGHFKELDKILELLWLGIAQRHFLLDQCGEFSAQGTSLWSDFNSYLARHAKTMTLPTWWHIPLSKWIITSVIIRWINPIYPIYNWGILGL